MMRGINTINKLSHLVAATDTNLSRVAQGSVPALGERWKNDLQKLAGKFPRHTDTAPAHAGRKEEMAPRPATAPIGRFAAGSTFFHRQFFTATSRAYDKATGKFLNYEKARGSDVAASVSWASDNDLLPKEASSIIDIGAAHGGAAVRLGKQYPDAAILALDPDPRSAEFIEGKVKTGNSVLKNPERLGTFSGTFLEALAEGKCKENSVSLVNMQAVAPYMSDEELDETLQGIHKALASGGKVVLSCYGEEHFSKDSTEGRALKLRTDMQMHGMFEKAGFKVECIGNILLTERGQKYEKNNKDMDDVQKQKGMPSHPEGRYWHYLNIVATKS